MANPFAMEEGRNVQKKLKHLERTRFLFKEFHPETSWAFYEVGKAYEEIGDYENELKYKIESLGIDKKFLKDEQELKNLAKSLNNVGLAYGHIGDFYNEQVYCLDALKILKKLSKNKYDAEIASLLGNVALSFGHMGDFESQLAFSLEALEIRKNIFKNEKNLDIALSLNSVGYSYVCCKNDTQNLALQYCLDSYKIHKNISSKPNIYLLRSVLNVGICYFFLKKYEFSKKFFLKALKISNEINQICKDHPVKSLILNNLGVVSFYQQEYNDCLENCKESVRIRENSYSKNHPFLILSYHNLSIICEEMDQQSEILYYKNKLDEATHLIESKCYVAFKKATSVFAQNLKIDYKVRIYKFFK